MKYLLLLLISLIGQVMTAQEFMAPRHLLIKKDSTYLLVDDTPGCWYTLEMRADKMGLIGDNLYYFDHKTIQFGGIQFENGRFTGAMESRVAEVSALDSHLKWELKQYLNEQQPKLLYNKRLYVNSYGKPFLIWWYKVPEKKTTGSRKKQVEAAGTGKKTIFQLYLDCITQGNTCVSVCVPVLEDEDILKEIGRMSRIANTFTSFGDTIDLDILYERTIKGNPYSYRDKNGGLTLELPDWFSVSRSETDNCTQGSFPEKDNITDMAQIIWEYKNDSSVFKRFIEKHEHKGEKYNYLLLSDNEQAKREFFSSWDPFFYYQSIFLDTKDLYFYIQYYSTRTTYEYNLRKLEELISKIQCHTVSDSISSPILPAPEF